jgi:hypothetical protein
VEVVKLLLSDPRVDPSVGGNLAIKFIDEIDGNSETRELLLKDKRFRDLYKKI